MAERLSNQPFQMTRLNLDELNDVLRRIQNELDRLAGLRGTILIYDSQHYIESNGSVLHGWGVKP